MKIKRIFPIIAALACICAVGCGMPEKNSIDQGNKTVFPVSAYEEGTLPVSMGDVMPFYDNGVMNIYHLRDNGKSPYFHPIARITTTDFVNYATEEEVLINFEAKPESVDAALGTGSVIKDKDGNYHFFYTGYNKYGQAEDVGLKANEVVRHAVSYGNQNNWEKDEDFLLYGYIEKDGKKIYKNDFRDPYVYYDEDEDIYNMLVTTRTGGDNSNDGHGVIKRYTSKTLDAAWDEWRDMGEFFRNDAGSYVMECPSYLEYNGYYYLAYSEQDANRVTHYRYKTAKDKDGDWKRFDRDSIDASGFYAGKLEKAEDKLYAFAWCARLKGGSSGGFDWGGNLVTHELKQLPTGELCAVMVSNVKNTFSTQVNYSFIDGKSVEEAAFDGGFSARCIEKLGANVTRISFSFTPRNTDGDFGMTFGIDGQYDNRLGSAVVAFDIKNGKLVCYNGVSSIVRYGPPLAVTDFKYSAEEEYKVDIIAEGEILSVYLNDTVCLTARFPDMKRKNFAFYSNGSKVNFKGIAFYE